MFTTKSIFITGTGTSVGKSFVSGLLLDFLRRQGIDAVYQKWVATGDTGLPEDLVSCHRMAGLEHDETALDLLAPYRFQLAASPHLAAEQEGKVIAPEVIKERFQLLCAAHELVLAEGAGGVMVPLTRELLLIDLMAALAPPVLIVAPSGLGTINHTLLTIEALRNRSIPILGVTLSDGPEQQDEVIASDNSRTLAEIGNITVFGRLARLIDPIKARQAFQPMGEEILRQIMA